MSVRMDGWEGWMRREEAEMMRGEICIIAVVVLISTHIAILWTVGDECE